MFKKMFSTMTQQSAKHLRGYNPFVEFKSDINRTLDKHIHMSNTILDKHIQMNNNIMMVGFGALGGGIVLLYQKTEMDKKELNQKIDTNKIELDQRIDHIDQKLTQVLSLMNARKGWFW
jgi:uncharacterized protein YjeT (DUF2065 family)